MKYAPWKFTLTDDGSPGNTDYGTRTVALGQDVLADPTKARKVLAHELLHVARGPAVASKAGEEEAAVERALAAAWVPFPVLASATATPGADDTHIAAACGIDLPTLHARHAALTADERDELDTIRGQADDLHRRVTDAAPDTVAVLDALNEQPAGGRRRRARTANYTPYRAARYPRLVSSYLTAVIVLGAIGAALVSTPPPQHERDRPARRWPAQTTPPVTALGPPPPAVREVAVPASRDSPETEPVAVTTAPTPTPAPKPATAPTTPPQGNTAPAPEPEPEPRSVHEQQPEPMAAEEPRCDGYLDYPDYKGDPDGDGPDTADTEPGEDGRLDLPEHGDTISPYEGDDSNDPGC